MTPEELLKKLQAEGVRTGVWESHPERTVQIPEMAKLAESLTQLRDLLEGVAEADRQKILELKLKVAQMTRGGGR